MYSIVTLEIFFLSISTPCALVVFSSQENSVPEKHISIHSSALSLGPPRAGRACLGWEPTGTWWEEVRITYFEEPEGSSGPILQWTTVPLHHQEQTRGHAGPEPLLNWTLILCLIGAPRDLKGRSWLSL